jgi:hypothetical protein
MVQILPPPPQRPPRPIFYDLKKGEYLIRIFDPNSYGTQALTFRNYGPLHRFDHHRGSKPVVDQERGVYYAAFTLSSCLVECFGDTGIIEIKGQQVASVEVIRPLRLLDLRGSGAMRAGSVSALAKVSDRLLSREWSRFFYERVDIYGKLDGLIFYNAHNDEEAIALYERATSGLSCPDDEVMALNDPQLRSAIQQAARDNHLIFGF